MANKTDGEVEKSIISSDMKIKGKITASGGLVLLGNVVGDIKCNNISLFDKKKVQKTLQHFAFPKPSVVAELGKQKLLKNDLAQLWESEPIYLDDFPESPKDK